MILFILRNEFSKYNLVALKKKVYFFKLESVLPYKNLPYTSFIKKKKKTGPC